MGLGLVSIPHSLARRACIGAARVGWNLAARVARFRSISDWDLTRDPGDTLSGDGFWWYNDTPNNFFRSYATTNPREDYAVSFAYYFRNEIGDYVYDSATGPTPAKFDNVERFLNSLGTA